MLSEKTRKMHRACAFNQMEWWAPLSSLSACPSSCLCCQSLVPPTVSSWGICPKSHQKLPQAQGGQWSWELTFGSKLSSSAATPSSALWLLAAAWLSCFSLSSFCLASFSAIFFSAFRRLFSSLSGRWGWWKLWWENYFLFEKNSKIPKLFPNSKRSFK